MRSLILALSCLIFFLLGLRLSGVVSKIAPYLVGSKEENSIVPIDPNAPVVPANVQPTDPNAPVAPANVQPTDPNAPVAPANVQPIDTNAPVAPANVQPIDTNAPVAPANVQPIDTNAQKTVTQPSVPEKTTSVTTKSKTVTKSKK